MSTQINQYLMWGINLPYEWHSKWEDEHGKPDGFYEHFEGFMSDSAYDRKINHKEGIFCLFDGCNGDFIIIGRVLAKGGNGEFLASSKPMAMPTLTSLEQEMIRDAVLRNFGVSGDFQHWLVTQYR